MEPVEGKSEFYPLKDQPSSIWNSLTDEQKQGILDAYEESEDDEKLIPLADVINKLR